MTWQQQAEGLLAALAAITILTGFTLMLIWLGAMTRKGRQERFNQLVRMQWHTDEPDEHARPELTRDARVALNRVCSSERCWGGRSQLA